MKNSSFLAFRLAAVWLFACQLFAVLTLAQWSTDPNVNTAICTATGNQSMPTLVSDGAGGAIITWYDLRNGINTDDIYAQRTNSSGAVQWTAGGVAICSATNDQRFPTLVSDGAGGAIITWFDARNGFFDIYAQRIDASGAVQWTADGVAICTAAQSQSLSTIVSDGAGGAIIAWNDKRNGSDYDIYAQRINAAGVVQWTADGVAVSTATNDQNYPAIVSDGVGGAIITWHDYRTGANLDIYAQRINDSGVVQWTANGVAISTAANYQSNPAIASDGAGGAIITWSDLRNGNDYDIYAQLINSAGVVQWTADGVGIATLSNNQAGPKIVSNAAGGAIITWYDYRNGASYDVYAQLINAAGVVQWTANSAAICTAAGDQKNPAIGSDGAGGATITWADQRSGFSNINIYAQRINAAGAVQWTANGVAISTATNDQQNPAIIGDGAGGATITWEDFRSGTDFNIHASRVFNNGALPIELSSFTGSVVNGNDVLLRWTTIMEINNYGFEIERKPLPSPPLIGEGTKGWGQVGFVSGSGTSNAPKEYSFTDKNITTGKYSYRLKQIDRDGHIKYSQSVEAEVGVAPGMFGLSQNYPNPFNPSTVISYQLPAFSKVTLRIYDVLGREVATLVNEEQSAGWKEVQWLANVVSGIYYYCIEAVSVAEPKNRFVQAKKMLLLK